MKNNKIKIESRDSRLDLIRSLACFGVVSVHFFLNNGFYREHVEGKRMYFMVYMRMAFMFCVPLFMILSGYLMNQKKPEKSYYKRIGKVLYVYLMASLFCEYGFFVMFDLFKRILKLDMGVQRVPGIRKFVEDLLGFHAAPYSWYIEMYIGLFLLIPFLNVLYNHLETKRHKQILILSIVAVSILPTFVNYFNFSSIEWWKHPSAVMENGQRYQTIKILPNWWENLYPLAYYFIGCYIKEYGIKIKRWTNILLIFAALALSGTNALWRFRGACFESLPWNNWWSLPVFLYSVLIFIFLINLDLTKIPFFIKRVLFVISELSLGIFLVSNVFDRIFYNALIVKVHIMPKRLEYYFVVAPAVFVCSGIIAYLINLIYKMPKMIKKKQHLPVAKDK